MAYGDMYDPNGNHLSDMTSQIKDDLTQTLRSVRDTLSTSFQTLNLTMASIHSTLRTMSSAFVPQGGVSHYPNMIPSFGANVNVGSLSGPMGQNLATSSMWGLLNGSKPFNVGGYEYAWERQKELNHRFTQFGVDAGLAIPGLAAGSLASMAALRYAGKSSVLGGAMKATGLGGAAARGLVGGIPGIVASMGVDAMTGVWSDAANEYGRDITGVRRMSTRFGNEFTNAQSAVVARGMSNYAHREMAQSTDFDTKLGMDGIRTVMSQGLQMNLFQGRKPEELVKQMETAAGVVKFLTGVLGSKDVNETMRYIGQMKNMGINMAQNPQYAMRMGLDAHKYGMAMGVPGAELLGQATQIGANAYGQYGMPSFGGIQPAMQSMALAHEMEKRKILSTAEVAAGGGHNNIASQMVGFTAGMMNHSGLGKMMLAAGWQGGGKYDMSKMQGALKGGGYFGAVDNALSGIAGDPDKYADFMMNLENLQASASEQGGLDKQTEEMLFAALDQMGTFKNDNTAAMMLKKLAESMGAPLSTAAAKTIVMKHRKPSTMRAIDREQQRGLNRGFHAQNSLENSPFRAFGRIGDSWDRLKGHVSETLVTKPAQWMRDKWMGVVGEPDEKMMGTGAGQFNEFTMDNYDGSMGGPSLNLFKTSDTDFHSAYAAGKNGMLFGKGGTGERDANFWMGGDSRQMLASMEGATARLHKGYYKAAMDQNGMGSHEALSSVSDLVQGGTSKLLAKYRQRGDSEGGDRGGSKYWNAQGGGTHFLADNMSDDTLSDLSRATTNSRWFKELRDGEANDIIASTGANREEYSDANEMMQRLLMDGTGQLDKYAKSKGISTRNLAYGLVASSYGASGVNSLSNFNKLMGASDSVFNTLDTAGGSLTRGEGNTFGIEQYAAQADNTMGITGEAGVSTLKSLGLTMDDIRDIVNTQGGRAQLNAFATIASKLVNGDDLDKYDYATITNPILRNAVEKLAAKNDGDKYGLSKSLGEDKNIGYSVKDADKINRFMGSIANVGSFDNARTAMSDMGFDNINDEDLKKAMQDKTIGKYASSLHGTTTQSKELVAKLQEVGGMSLDDLHSQYGDLTRGKTSLEDARNTVQNSLMRTTKQDIDVKNSEKDVQKSLIDTTVDTSYGKNVMRVMVYGKELDNTADSLRNKTPNTPSSQVNVQNIVKSVLPNSGSPTNTSTSTGFLNTMTKLLGW